MFVNFNILNQLGSPAINSNTFANRPAAGQTGRLFVSTDTFEIYRDTGTTWDLIGGPGTSTITGTGTATQVAYFTSSQAIGSSANLYWDNTNNRLGINTATPGAALDIHGTGTIQQINSTSATANSLLAFQRSGTGLWRIGDNYNAGSNYFELYNTVLGTTGLQLDGATNKAVWQSQQTYSTGLARGNYFDLNLSVAANGSFSSPNAITALGASLDLTLAGNATIPSGARTGLDAYNSVSFTGAGTLTMTQGTQIRPYSNITAGWAFAGSATGTITHLAGLRVLFPDNSGSAVTITNNYGLLINDQTANTGSVTYTNRWGIYQEGASDLNYFAANTLICTTTNAGYKLDVNGTARIIDNVILATNANSKVGIGTTSPQYPLDVVVPNSAAIAIVTTRETANGPAYFVGRCIGGTYASPTDQVTFGAIFQSYGYRNSAYREHGYITFSGVNATTGNGIKGNWSLFLSNDSSVITQIAQASALSFNIGGNYLQTTYTFQVTGQSLFSGGLGQLAANITNTTTAVSGVTGYGLLISSEASASTSYALHLINGNGSVSYGGVSTVTGQVGYWSIGFAATGTIGNRLTVNGAMSVGSSSYLTTAAPSNGAMIQGNVLIGTTTDTGQKFQVNGLSALNGQLLVNKTTSSSTWKIETNGKTLSNGNTCITGQKQIASGATETIYTIPATSDASGLYHVFVGAPAGSQIYTASGTVTASAWNSEAVFTSIYDGSNVTLQVTGMNIEIVNNGFATISWNYTIHFIPITAG